MGQGTFEEYTVILVQGSFITGHRFLIRDYIGTILDYKRDPCVHS